MTVQAVQGGQRAVTPTVGRVLRRALFWIGAALFVLVVAVVSFAVAGSGVGGVPLSATNPAPGGAMAVAEVLKQHGVTVTPTGSLDETRTAIAEPSATTLLVYDNGLFLDANQLADAVRLADTVIILDPSFGQLRAVAPGVAQAGAVSGDLRADCSVPEVQRAGTVSGGGSGYRVTDDTLDVTTCLGSGDRVYSLVKLDGGRLTLLGATDALSNEHVAENGNAALMLGLLGSKPNLVWYIPTSADLPVGEAADLGSLTPAWVSPVLALLVITAIAAAVWRGRRLGPLVIENLPVTVRASETMRGRARLYEKSSARLRALDSLRIGAIGRLAAACGLPRTATAEEVVAAVAGVTGRQPGEVSRLLVDDIPDSDADLVALSDSLLVIEHDVAAGLAP